MKYDLYLCGPISGPYAETNLEAFAEGARMLRAAGYTVFCPPEDEPRGLAWADYLRRDIPYLVEAHGVALLPGWEESKGALLEKYIAESLGATVRPIGDWLSGPPVPWARRTEKVVGHIGKAMPCNSTMKGDLTVETFAAEFARLGGNPVKASGETRDFGTGSVRDNSQGKGRCDLLPARALLELAKHFEHGANHYGDRNWEKGQPIVRSYLDSGHRHLLKVLAGQTDEDHLLAAAWNLMCAIDTRVRVAEGKLPEELNDLGTLV